VIQRRLLINDLSNAVRRDPNCAYQLHLRKLKAVTALSMIIDHPDFLSIAIGPSENNWPLVVDADRI
jgi:hypothetical protein